MVRAADAGEAVIVADLDRRELARIRATRRMPADRPAALPSERARLVVG
ncbi:MAG: hypothetical protein ACRD0A_19230 [Acidimicrobiales bacterium]